MNSPALLSTFTVIFILLGSYNLFTGLKRVRAARAQGVPITWFKQLNVMTGTEYILLACVFLLSYASQQKTLSPALHSILIPLYFVLLIAAAIMAGLVIRQGLRNSRMLRTQSATQKMSVNATSSTMETVEDDAKRDREYQERRRERRRNAAAARRRRSGKA
jgi:type IV secretory pathway VirB6-like protein